MGQKKEETKVNGAEKKNEGIVLKLDLHCEGCAQKVRRFIRHTHGVENVKSDCETGKLTVKGDVDPSWLRERVEIKTKKTVELISSPPKKDGGSGAAGDKKSGGDGTGDKKSGEKTEKKTEDRKADDKKPKETQVISVVALKIRVHCDGCAHKIKRVIKKIKGVQEVNIESEKDLATVKGTMDINKLTPYLIDKLKQKVEVVQSKKDNGSGEKKGKEGDSDKKEKESSGGGGGGGDKKEKGGTEKKDGDSKAASSGGGGIGGSEVVNKMEYSGYNANTFYAMPMQHQSYMNQDYGATMYDHGYAHTGYVAEYGHPPQYVPPPPPPTYLNAPQMFSDENPNGCFIM
ncbi:heavy metal-associated isoprenylated plant protein 6-like [Solanum dulcamara]|uniref:heavy metal-associated isoprenylated plant protein 6-like n=1 Tax=Solanum dulcamara TaxID=45834 RepID=UPI002486C56A|nr:heavy metal-associated isoprenylated plant protein 6-like [Solanum dulcamara]